MKKIGFIGVGVMGKPMVRNLQKAGFTVSVYSRTRSKIEDFLAETGARWCDTPAACAAGQEAVVTMVGYPKDVEEVYFGECGVLSGAEAGAYLIDMTTTDPRLSVRIDEAARARGMHALDAPVSGGDTGAVNGTLSIMVGGAAADFAACLPLFEAMGANILHEGPAGSGQHTKMANQIAIAGALSGVCEALRYAERAGLDPETTLRSISAGAAGSWQMQNLMPKMIAHDDKPGFFLKHFIKDMNIARAQDERPLPVLTQVCEMCAALAAEGYGDCGTQALIHYYREKA